MHKLSSLVCLASLGLGVGACQQAQQQSSASLEIFDIELREKINTCRELDPQVAKETLFLERLGERGILHLGAERTFPVQLSAGAISADFLETDHATVAERHVVCKRITKIDLSVGEGRITGSYERKRRQECLMEAKPCATTWKITGSLRQ